MNKKFNILFSVLFTVSIQATIHIASRDSIDPFENGHETVRELTGKFIGTSSKHSVALIDIAPQGFSPKHLHNEIEESYFVLQGQGRVIINGEEAQISKGQLVVIPPQTTHQVFNDHAEPLQLLVVAAEAWTPDCMVFTE